jgi:hypothetical protein
MTMDGFGASRTRWVWRRSLVPPSEGFPAHPGYSWDLVANRWHEESKRRYEDLAHQWLALAEQRQRCA